MSDRKLTILHTNDIHGDFLSKQDGEKETGGLAYLSGYVHQIRSEEENVLFAIAGDLFKGSIIDSEYKGLSTIELMNLLNPDVVTLGNHEVDYGLSHLLFVEKCARFPIINANLFIKTNHVRLFTPYIVKQVGKMQVMFIGLITEEILASTKKEGLVGTFVDVTEAAKEVGTICNTYKTLNVDCTVLLTHIGFEEDKQLASLLRPEWGIDLIIGGHSHTLLEEPCYVNNIPIVQVGTGTGHIGRIDMLLGENPQEGIKEFHYQVVSVDSKTCPKDDLLAEALDEYKEKTDEKYSQVITTFARKLTHPKRNQETELGNLFADVMQDGSSFDIMLLGSGSLRLPELGPVVHLQDLKEFFPYDDGLYMIEVTGKQFRSMISYMLREETFLEGSHTEFYQVSSGCHFVWSRSKQTFIEFSFNGKEISDDQKLKLGMQEYHYQNFSEIFNLPIEDILENSPSRLIGTSCCCIYEELLANSKSLDRRVEGRITVLE